METITRADFAKEPGKYQEEAQFRQPVIITTGRNKKPGTVLLSYEMFKELISQSRYSLLTKELDSKTFGKIMSAEMDHKHEYLNDLLDDNN